MAIEVNVDMNWGLYLISKDDKYYTSWNEESVIEFFINRITYNDNNIKSSIFDTQLCCLINELYYVEGLKRIHESEHYNKEADLERLDILDKWHSDLQLVKSILCLEVEDSINRIKQYQRVGKDSNFFETTVTYQYFREIWHVIRKEDYETIYSMLTTLISSEEFTRIEKTNFEVWNKLQSDVHRCFYFYHKNSKKKFLRESQLFIHSLRDLVFGENDEKRWLLELLRIYNNYLNIGGRLSEYDGDDFSSDFLTDDTFSKVVTKFLSDFNSITAKKQSTLCYQMIHSANILTRKDLDFYIHTKKLTDALARNKHLKKLYIENKKTSDSVGCYALLKIKHESKEFVALSGVKDYITGKDIDFERALKQLKLLLPSYYEIVRLNDNVRYYLNTKKSITYKESLTYFDFGLAIDKNEKGQLSPMFSCCERKLLTQISGYYNLAHKSLYIKYKPCYKCKRAIDAHHNCFPIISPEGKKLKDRSKKFKNKSDDLATRILVSAKSGVLF